MRELRGIKFRVPVCLCPPFLREFIFPNGHPPTHMQLMKKNSCCMRVTNLTGSLVLFFFLFRSKETYEITRHKDCFLVLIFSLVFENHASYKQLKAIECNWRCKGWREGILPSSTSSVVLKRRTTVSRSW